MANAWNLIQLYPALNKLVSDLNGYWQGQDVAKERILNHKIDDLLTALQKPRVVTCDASTQTESICPASPCFLSPFQPPRLAFGPETPREWQGTVTGMGRREDLEL